MSTTLTVNGTGYSFPNTGDENWGDNVTNWASAVTSGMLQKAGGTFILTAEVDFGANFGLKTAYVKSRATNPSSAGILRLGNTEAVAWRNAANSADLSLIVNASNKLLFNAVELADLTSTQTFTGKTMSGASNTFSNIAYASLVLTGGIVNADIGAAAAIAWSKMAALTASRALVSDVSGVVSVSAVTSTELGYLAGVTSGVQSQIDTKASQAQMSTVQDNLNTHMADDTDAHDASAISVAAGITGLAATEVQAALAEISGDVDAHLADATDAHDASAISSVASGNLAATNVQSALDELQTDIDTRATSTALTNHINDGTDAHAASAITNTPTGNLAATTVQAALDELQTDVDGRVSKSTLTAKGDLYVATASGVVTRIAVGADNTFLKANSGATEGVSWASPSGSALALSSKTGAYTVTTSDDIIVATSGSWTLTLYAASGNSGKVLRVKNAGSGVITIDGNASETIDGATTFVMSQQYESIELACDGSNWHVMNTKSFGTTVESVFTLAAWPITVNQYGDLTSISIPAGTWAVSANAYTDNNGAISTTLIRVGISSTSGNSFPGVIQGSNSADVGLPTTTNGAARSISVANLIVTPGSTTTYYLKGYAETSITNLRVGCRITAVRIK